MGRGRASGILLGIGIIGGLGSPGELEAQDPKMNFFVMVQGSTVSGPTVRVSDQHCQERAYALGFGSDWTWRAYINGTQAEGEAAQVARTRIGPGPWYNYYGQLIAQDVAQLHSDRTGLDQSTATTLTGEVVATDVLAVPPGAQLDGSRFTKQGPYFCFGT